MRMIRTAVACAAVILVAVAATWRPSASPTTAALKGGNAPALFADAPEPIYVIDAKAADRDSMTTLDAKMIESVEVPRDVARPGCREALAP